MDTFYYLGFISHLIKEILYLNTNFKENHEIKTKRYTFSLISDIDVKKSCRVKISYQQFLMFLFHHSHWFHEHFQKTPFAGVLG